MADYCEPCDKTLYASERSARMAHKTAGFRVRTYRCENGGRGYHASNGEKRGLMKKTRPVRIIED